MPPPALLFEGVGFCCLPTPSHPLPIEIANLTSSVFCLHVHICACACTREMLIARVNSLLATAAVGCVCVQVYVLPPKRGARFYPDASEILCKRLKWAPFRTSSLLRSASGIMIVVDPVLP